MGGIAVVRQLQLEGRKGGHDDNGVLEFSSQITDLLFSVFLPHLSPWLGRASSVRVQSSHRGKSEGHVAVGNLFCCIVRSNAMLRRSKAQSAWPAPACRGCSTVCTEKLRPQQTSVIMGVLHSGMSDDDLASHGSSASSGGPSRTGSGSSHSRTSSSGNRVLWKHLTESDFSHYVSAQAHVRRARAGAVLHAIRSLDSISRRFADTFLRAGL